MNKSKKNILIPILIIFSLFFLPKEVFASNCTIAVDSYSLSYKITNGSTVDLLTLPGSTLDNRGGPYPDIAYSATAGSQGKLVAKIDTTQHDCSSIDITFYIRYWDGTNWTRQEFATVPGGVGGTWSSDSKSFEFKPNSGIAYYYIEYRVYAYHGSSSSKDSWWIEDRVLNFVSNYDNPATSFTSVCINKICTSSDVAVFSDGKMDVTATFKNTGNTPQGWWYTGIEGWRVGDFNDPWGIRSNPFWAYYNGKDGTGGGLSSPQIKCNVDNKGALNLKESKIVTCSFPASLWTPPTTGNERIMFWLHERDLGVDKNGRCTTDNPSSPDQCGTARNCSTNTGCFGGDWWFDSITRVEPSQIRISLSTDKAPIVSTTGTSPGSTSTTQTSGTCNTTDPSLSRASGLISAPNLINKFNTSSGLCVIDNKATFVPYKIPNFDDIKSLYFDQSKASKATIEGSTDQAKIDEEANTADIIYTTGNLDINADIPNGVNKPLVVFVKGNLNINTDINYGENQSHRGLVFVVSGDVNINPSVVKINAVLISQGTIYTAGTGCTTSAEAASQLVINGSLIALDSSKKIKFCRKLTDNTQPAEKVIVDPKYMVILKDLISDTLQKWSELP